MVPDRRKEPCLGTYWYLVREEGWQSGETTRDPELPIPVMCPVGCVAVGVSFALTGESVLHWRLLWTWRDEAAVRESMDRYGALPPSIQTVD